MENKRINLSEFCGNNFDKGASSVKIVLWYFVNVFFVRPAWIPFMKFKIIILKLFGAKIGKDLCIKPCVNVKSPWYLVIGDNVWLGEKVWIDNLDRVIIGDNVCISQGAMLLTGNHDYSLHNMPYRNASIHLEDGVWIGAQAIVAPGVIAYSHSLLTVGSIATKNLEPFSIYQGNPALFIRKRIIK